MTLWIAFFRGINVGGHRILPMKELKTVLEGLGCDAVWTYIQTGNVIFTHREVRATILEATIREAVISNFGFEARVILLTCDDLEAAVAKNPFCVAMRLPKTQLFYLLASEPGTIDRDLLDSLKSDTEQFQLVDRVFYLHAPGGIGRSKLAASVEKCLGVPVTARNGTTIEKVLQRARQSRISN
jgi:uncharacterized protein (DUF1697 family)